MDENQQKPRVNASMLPRYHGSAVCLLGMMHSPEPNGAGFQLTTSDKQNVKVTLQQPLQEYASGLIEVHGVVQPNNSVLCQRYVLFPPENSNDFDMDLYNKGLMLMNQYPEHYIMASAK